ncbi:diacylglycerol kinase family protein [Pedobacter nyackensis]|uniref:diacylglycerol kinase family protein n=1 Tax=Pedobacter nyackensis TaxID=475255 RepID=UPI0029312A22|nr:diacylglycerol kinase family protein [Pedobacter nyackensis]
MNRFLKSFGYAFSGLGYAFKSQFNFKFHVVALLVVGLLGWYCQLSPVEWLWIIMASGMVLMAELLNTAIEVLVNLVSPDIHPKAKIIKDVAAAAVLVTAITALGIGLVIFIPKMVEYAT